jgi:DinB family protein
MDPNHKLWNQGHQKLRLLLSGNDHQKAIELFLTQHAMVHSAKVSKPKLWSFEDEILNGMSEDQIRCLPPGGEHSIAWILFHLARIEDITMNMLAAGAPQLFVRDDWGRKLRVAILHSANEMDKTSVASLSVQIDIEALRAYRQSVGRRTREIVRKLKPEELGQKAEASRLQKVLDEGALLPDAIGILNYWSKRTIAGLLLMPPTRHNFLHLNEALRIKQKLQQ